CVKNAFEAGCVSGETSDQSVISRTNQVGAVGLEVYPDRAARARQKMMTSGLTARHVRAALAPTAIADDEPRPGRSRAPLAADRASHWPTIAAAIRPSAGSRPGCRVGDAR